LQQNIIVETKGQLIAAFYCAIFTEHPLGFLVAEYPPDTVITFKRKSGVTVYNLKAAYNKSSEKALRRAIANIRRIPAKELCA